ncbi:exosome complex component RRP45-like [Saccoglossus kowalevskii]|uniref:Exosome complex component RRP45 n=1 Tax=Saccoglossus kowalevskii TaxID=10224 RepID=A0ABM0GQ34_SACKO|nr:PREDICTED: exosome complex component RRP45-like [Saccoglossus kowalevskii]
MCTMKKAAISNAEKDFILTCIKNRRRVDGRQAYDFRNAKISFGQDLGHCEVQLGDTRVLCQVSCEIIEPRQNRPTEGGLYFNVELSPMASPLFEPGRQSEFGIEIIRFLEKTVRDSRAIDTESLCIVAGEKVWEIRIDIHVLNHDGNIMDCVTMAAVTALSHFRRPDVSVVGEDVQVHSAADRDPVSLSVHHLPVSVTFAYFDEGKYLLVDPTEREECVMDGSMILSMNIHRELCTAHMSGDMLLVKDQIIRCTQTAIVKVSELTDLIKKALENDRKARASGNKCGFAETQRQQKVTYLKRDVTEVDVSDKVEIPEITLDETEDSKDQAESLVVLGKGTVQVGEGGHNTWLVDDVQGVKPVQQKRKKKKKHAAKKVKDAGSSEEEETVILVPDS